MFKDDNIQTAASIIRCKPTDLKRALLRRSSEASIAKKDGMNDAAMIVERKASQRRTRLQHTQAHALNLAAKAIRKAAQRIL